MGNNGKIWSRIFREFPLVLCLFFSQKRSVYKKPQTMLPKIHGTNKKGSFSSALSLTVWWFWFFYLTENNDPEFFSESYSQEQNQLSLKQWKHQVYGLLTHYIISNKTIFTSRLKATVSYFSFQLCYWINSRRIDPLLQL